MPYTVIAIIPPKEQEMYLGFLQRTWNKKYGVLKAPEYPLHITLKSLGEVEKKKELNIVYSHVIKIAEKTKPFKINVNGIRFSGTNEKYPGIYLGVEKSKELGRLHETLVEKLEKFADEPRPHKELENYNPHMTLVGTDIGQEAYERAKKDIQESGWSPKFSFDVGKIYVLQKEGSEKEYKIAKEYGLLQGNLRS